MQELHVQRMELIDTLVEFLLEQKNNLPMIIQQFRVGEVLEAHDLLIVFLTDMMDFVEGLKLISAYHQINTADLKVKFDDLYEAMENSDYTLIADILEYEILEKMDLWIKDLRNNDARFH